MPRFVAYDLAVEAAVTLGPLLETINRRDPDLCRQVRRASSSVALCLDEGSQRTGRDRLHLYRIAAGSAAEARTGLTLARAWGYVTEKDVLDIRGLQSLGAIFSSKLANSARSASRPD